MSEELPKAGIYVQTHSKVFSNDDKHKDRRDKFINGIMRGVREIIIRHRLELYVIICVDIYYKHVDYNEYNIRKEIFDILIKGDNIKIPRFYDYPDIPPSVELNLDELDNYVKSHVIILFPNEHVHGAVGRNIIYNYIRRDDKYNFLWFGSDDDDIILPTAFIHLYYKLHRMSYINNINKLYKHYITSGYKVGRLKQKIDSETTTNLSKLHNQAVDSASDTEIENFVILHHPLRMISIGIFGGAPWYYLIDPHKLPRYGFRTAPFNKEDIEMFERYVVNDKLLYAPYLIDEDVISPYVYCDSNNSGLSGYFDESFEEYLTNRSNINNSGPLSAQPNYNKYYYNSPKYYDKLGIKYKYSNSPEWDHNEKLLIKKDIKNEVKHITPDGVIVYIANDKVKRLSDDVELNIPVKDVETFPIYHILHECLDEHDVDSRESENYNGDLYIVKYNDGTYSYYTLQNGYFPLNEDDYATIFDDFINKNINEQSNIVPYIPILSQYIPKQRIIDNDCLYNKFIVKNLYKFILNEKINDNIDNTILSVVKVYNNYLLGNGEYGRRTKKIPPKVIGGLIDIFKFILTSLLIITIILLIYFLNPIHTTSNMEHIDI